MCWSCLSVKDLYFHQGMGSLGLQTALLQLQRQHNVPCKQVVKIHGLTLEHLSGFFMHLQFCEPEGANWERSWMTIVNFHAYGLFKEWGYYLHSKVPMCFMKKIIWNFSCKICHRAMNFPSKFNLLYRFSFKGRN